MNRNTLLLIVATCLSYCSAFVLPQQKSEVNFGPRITNDEISYLERLMNSLQSNDDEKSETFDDTDDVDSLNYYPGFDDYFDDLLDYYSNLPLDYQNYPSNSRDKRSSQGYYTSWNGKLQRFKNLKAKENMLLRWLNRARYSPVKGRDSVQMPVPDYVKNLTNKSKMKSFS